MEKQNQVITAPKVTLIRCLWVQRRICRFRTSFLNTFSGTVAANAEMQRELQKLRTEVSELNAEKLKVQARFQMSANIDAAIAEL